jgi:hypothetical protein
MLQRRFALCLLLLAVPALQADVTLRYKLDFKMAMPTTTTASAAPALPFSSQLLRIKGDKAYSEAGKSASLINLARQEIMLLDRENKHFATVSVKQYKDAVAGRMQETLANFPPEASKALEAMKTSVESRKTGRSEVIQGIQAEEREVVITISLLMPEGLATAGSPMMKMIMQEWTAKPEEALRVPALRELGAYSSWADYAFNPSEWAGTMFQMIPGLGKTLDSTFQELSANKSMVLRMRMAMYMPMAAAVAQEMARQGQAAPAGLDPDAPLVEMTTDLVELSTASIDDSVFRVPADYQPVPIQDLMKSTLPAAPNPAKQ